MALIHGGNLTRASREFGIPVADWLDLSTGISPWSWPVPPVPEPVWRRLPEDSDDLAAVAAACYGCRREQVLPVPGSQYALQQLPALLPATTVALPLWGYGEHLAAWQRAGHRIHRYRNEEELTALVADGDCRHGVVINPGNPTAQTLAPARLRRLASLLAEREGWLLVDEAFMDSRPALSLAGEIEPGLVVLRSLGKFFGLAGVRLGFALAEPGLLARLAADLPPWAVSHPARWVGAGALADLAWQQRQRTRMVSLASTWHRDLQALLPALSFQACDFFASGTGPWALCRRLYRQAGERGLLLRLLGPEEDVGMVRLGLPAPDRRQQALAIVAETGKAIEEK